MQQTPRLVIPVGHFLGVICYGPEGDSVRYNIRIGWADFDVTLPEYLTWCSAHGPAVPKTDQPWTLDDTRLDAEQIGVLDATTAAEQLLAKGLLREVALGTDEVFDFAQRHQVFPLALGLGNGFGTLDQFQIGTGDSVLATVTLPVYALWSRAHLEASLWRACALLAESEMPLAPGATPNTVASDFLGIVHRLLATNSMYIDTLRNEVAS